MWYTDHVLYIRFNAGKSWQNIHWYFSSVQVPAWTLIPVQLDDLMLNVSNFMSQQWLSMFEPYPDGDSSVHEGYPIMKNPEEDGSNPTD